MFFGTYSHTLDAKNRLIIPSELRPDLGDVFFITQNLDNCLSLYPAADFNALREKLDTLPKITNEAARKLRRFYFANSRKMEPDAQGRILIPGTLREYAGRKKKLVLLGVDDHVEIWDEDTWNTYNKETRPEDLLYDLKGFEL